MGKRLAPHFAAHVKTDEVHVVPTAAGAFPQNVEVFVERGGELPDNLADGEEDRLKRLGAFDPLPPLDERVRAQGARLQRATAPEGEAVTNPGVVPVDFGDDDLPPPLPEGTLDRHGRASNDLAMGTAPEGEAVQPDATAEERFAAVQERAADARAQRTTKKAK